MLWRVNARLIREVVKPSAQQTGEHTIYRLGHGNDHRGATWFDESNGVLWLCAYGLHRSGDADDAFPHFHELIQSGNIWPTENDYEALFLDRDRRFVETLPRDAQVLLARARSNPGVEQTGVIGGEETTGVLVEVVETLEETYVVFSLALYENSSDSRGIVSRSFVQRLGTLDGPTDPNSASE